MVMPWRCRSFRFYASRLAVYTMRCEARMYIGQQVRALARRRRRWLGLVRCGSVLISSHAAYPSLGGPLIGRRRDGVDEKLFGRCLWAHQN